MEADTTRELDVDVWLSGQDPPATPAGHHLTVREPGDGAPPRRQTDSDRSDR